MYVQNDVFIVSHSSLNKTEIHGLDAEVFHFKHEKRHGVKYPLNYGDNYAPINWRWCHNAECAQMKVMFLHAHDACKD